MTEQKAAELKNNSALHSNPERALMARIRTEWGSAISEACHISSVPPEFLGALIANESGGNETAARFEPRVYARLIAVRDGAEARFGALRRGDLARFADPEIRYLASSLGLMQIMGYHAAERGVSYERLMEPQFNLHFALLMLGRFAQQFKLDVRSEFAELFRCWNTGRPDGQTADPNYVANGLARMAAYEQARAAHATEEGQ